ncbi:dirigent protein 22-like [Andrographis paniculata]|uniref:dirigent protein 22-like n=1 Tax=Andrographis paniculata TaxID=175694 RepID=UPI0021E80092|nr:dirigent protein 22-like [Andrographis paniculata]
MAHLLSFSLLLLAAAATVAAADPDAWFRAFSRKKEKSAVIRFYLHSAEGGPEPNLYEVARSSITATSPTQFGLVRVLDDKATADPIRSSPELGRAQGMITSADLREPAVAVAINVVFTAGPYNGSTVCVAGRNPIGIPRGRELAILGGTGIFRMARGYLIENTYSFEPVERYFVFENTLYVRYYD